MADTEQPQQPIEEQVTSKTPAHATKQKNPKRVTAGKATAAKTKIARAEQRKALIEAQSIIANQQTKPAHPPSVADTPSDDPPSVETNKNVLTTTQWLSIISIVVSLAGVYYKREEIKSVFAKKTPVETPRAPPPTEPKRSIRGME